MSGTVHAGERGVDFSFARPPAARLVELGYTFVVGYISVAPASPAKNITKAECEAYLAAGLKVLLVWEMTASRANLGAAYGAIDGAHAKTLAAQRGYPVDVPILLADDTNTTTVNSQAHADYMFAALGAIGPYTIGEYGDCDILQATQGLWRIGWVPNAWSWSARSRAAADARAKALGAHVLQRTGFWIDQTWAVDPNEAIADFPAWSYSQDSADTSTGSTNIGDDMAFISNKTAGKYGSAASPQGGCTIWELVREGARYSKNALSFPEWIALGQPFGVACDDGTLDQIPDWVAPSQSTSSTPSSFTGTGNITWTGKAT